ncbi:electron transport complex subunit RsxC [candidate division WOR-3 bacterium]|uniref:Ion-translocating oxidoreductase complex subunit C n=1 Tax=candidate division WOR-3 bacterium TaxID=2052148 RepID=A0A937XEN2_UNCW3|nr:electron transport complex subunit RsxC [candidate division WOR-3 bacterium]
MLTFRGGVHPREDKEATEHKSVEVLPLPARVFIPLSQHTGAPSKAVVAKGSLVKTGTLIGEPAGRISAATHASVSGTVADVSDLPHPLTGRRGPTVVIDSDGADTPDDALGERDYSGFTNEQIVETLRLSGVVGLGGAAFPTYFKLTPPKEKPIDTLLINGCECEPFLTADHRLMLEQPAEMVEGVKIMSRVLGVQNVMIVIEDNKPDAVATMTSAAASSGFKVRKLRTKYPQGAEKQLIKACLKREVPSGGLPMDVGCVVQNVGTALAVRDALRLNRPLYERVTTVTGPAIKEPKNLRVRIGTPVKELLQFCGGYAAEVGKLIMGGPMMGIAVSTDEVPVLKGTSGVLVLDRAATVFDEHDCIRCGRCIEACPMGLAPQRLNNLIRRGQLEAAKAEHVKDCIECGCCAYACPAKIRLVHQFKYAKSELAAMERK